MRILPLEYLTVMFSSKTAMSEQRRDLSCQFVSISAFTETFSAGSIPVSPSKQSRTLLSILPLISHLHPEDLSTCEIRLIENSVYLLQADKDLFPLGH